MPIKKTNVYDQMLLSLGADILTDEQGLSRPATEKDVRDFVKEQEEVEYRRGYLKAIQAVDKKFTEKECEKLWNGCWQLSRKDWERRVQEVRAALHKKKVSSLRGA